MICFLRKCGSNGYLLTNNIDHSHSSHAEIAFKIEPLSSPRPPWSEVIVVALVVRPSRVGPATRAPSRLGPRPAQKTPSHPLITRLPTDLRPGPSAHPPSHPPLTLLTLLISALLCGI